MVNEIGSEFYDSCTPSSKEGICIKKNNYHLKTVLSGRTALDLIIKDIIKDIGLFSVYIPSYCCESMLLPFISNDISVKYYQVFYQNNKLFFDYDFDNDCKVVFLLDYFGYKNEYIKKILEVEHDRGKKIIFDITQSFFSDYTNYYPDYMFVSFRKWFNINLGCAYKLNEDICIDIKNNTNQEYVGLRNKAYCLKSHYIYGDNNDKSIFLSLFSQAENILNDDYVLYPADQKSLDRIEKTSKEYIISRRKENAQFLIESILQMNSKIKLLFQNVDNNIPLFVPIFVNSNDRNRLRKHLIDNNIYCPIHWPISKMHSDECKMNILYTSTISLICDQRYNIKDMERIIDVINQFR